jgi:hypothetical protein
MSTPEALELADKLDAFVGLHSPISAELRRQHAEIERLRAERARMAEWLRDQGLLYYHDMCTRPDGTHGPAWVVREVLVRYGSPVAWHPFSADGALAALLVEKKQEGQLQ